MVRFHYKLQLLLPNIGLKMRPKLIKKLMIYLF